MSDDLVLPEFLRRAHPENTVDQIDFHPLANLFPMMDDEAHAALTADIKEHGLYSAIVLYEGKILDGRNRYRACIEAGVEPRTGTFSGADPIAYVVSHNLHRRHLNSSQRAMVAARLATLTVGAPSEPANVNAGIPAFTLTQPAVAKLFNVDRTSVQRARIVLNQGTDEEIAAVDSGDMSVWTISSKIKAAVPPEDRLKKNPDANTARHATQRANGKMWRMFKEALLNLTGLPRPSDVVRIVRTQDRQNTTNEKLLQALQWLTEFSDAWTSPVADAQANSRGKNKSPRKAREAVASQAPEGGASGEGEPSNGHWREDHPDTGEGSRAA